ncbi:acyl-CoA synthetase [Desulfococcus multivorans]|uniref:CoA-binding domain protein n=2 Tax=Desulfococcus multivorans TaxID=897 RepID=S7UUT0_DESML|nr:CoA-binding domain protein [Desulfococcus multivorans]AQV01864.1 acyl-CoA synthetase [Desulfococcus multivorans]EPR37829.1 CoA-binding domain protein [Desulfococcus multivorans DSM 2059]SKA17180.1 acetyltransferase [Desulfococcus multivorans DSM 2059]
MYTGDSSDREARTFAGRVENNGIDPIINARSIAVIGASNRVGSVGLAAFKNLLSAGYKGVLYPVHPREKSIQGVKAYPALEAIPDFVDLAVVIIGADQVPGIVQSAADRGIKGCIVISAGFKEIGGHGVVLENRLKQIAASTGIRIIGPNCLGIINTDPDIRMNASFARIMPKSGNIAFISQSGALCTSVLDYAAGRNIGFSKFISFGNKADINEIDFLRYLKEDPDTQLILMYLEDISSGHAFMEIGKEITYQAGKPILVVKSGRSTEGARAAASHTGSLAGSDATYDAIFYQSGIQRVEGINELFNYAEAFSKQPLPRGNRVAIVTNAGGPGIMATDAAVRHGLKLATLSEETRAKLKTHLPPTASLGNPVDVIGDATHERYEAAIRTVVEDDGVDGAIVILTPQAMTDILETAEILPRVAADVNKPILGSFMGMVDVSEGVEYLQSHGIPNYVFPEAAARSMAAMVRFGERLATRERRRVITRMPCDADGVARFFRVKLAANEKAYVSEAEAYDIFAAYHLPVPRRRMIRDASEIDDAVAAVGLPAVMKIVSPDIIHKSDAGGVKVNLSTPEAVRSAYDEIIANALRYKADARIDGVLMVEMAGKGVEVILGATRDPAFGPICMFGLGGIFVEVMKDVTFRLAPMWELSAENMIRQIKSFRILEGVRGNPPSDLDALKQCIMKLSQLAADHPEIREMDINPLIVYPEGGGCVVADGRIMLERPRKGAV